MTLPTVTCTEPEKTVVRSVICVWVADSTSTVAASVAFSDAISTVGDVPSELPTTMMRYSSERRRRVVALVAAAPADTE